MDTIDLEKLFQRGYYVTLGATSSLLEVIQDPIKREENLQRLGRSFDQITQELAEKGVTVEAEARSYVDNFIAQQVNGSAPAKSDNNGLTTVNTTAQTVDENAPNVAESRVKSSVRSEIQELTEQLANLRSELEQLRSK